MNGAFFAKTAVLFKLDPVGIVLFVFRRIVIALFALGAFERNSYVFRFHKTLRISLTKIFSVVDKSTAETVL